jgi:hypothetical protein
MSQADQFRQYAEEALRWAYQSKTEKKQTSPDRACAHMDASCGAERENCGRQSARAQAGPVRPPQLTAPLSPA